MLGKNRTKEEQQRIEAIHERGCVPCWIEAKLRQRQWRPEPCDIHHTIQNDHMSTYGNCPWHHRGIPKNDYSTLFMSEMFGPSMCREPRRYRIRYGNEADLLALQNRMLVQSIPELEQGILDGPGPR